MAAVTKTCALRRPRIVRARAHGRLFDCLSALAASVALVHGWFLLPMTEEPFSGAAGGTRAGSDGNGSSVYAEREIVVSGYAGAPLYHRSDVKLTRPDGTDLTLKDLGWDGDPFYFPIDGGIRSVHWSGHRGLMIDFLHNKAIARTGKGSHGRTISNGVIEEVDASGTLKGQPAPDRIKLTDMFERLEFTHGHNVLLLTPVARLSSLTPRMRPYFGVGAGIAVPHVEVRFAGEPRETRTNEYQLTGAAWQVLAGVELRSGRGSYYLEYKFTWAGISALLTGGEAEKNLDLPSILGVLEGPGDLYRQFVSWWNGEEPKQGRLTTQLPSHQVFVGAGYVWPR